MIDFPASPTLGQQFTAAGVTWTWDGTKWTSSGLSVAYLPLAGGTMTGPIVLSADPAAAMQPVTLQYFNARPMIGDNRIINGDMRIDQRNNGAASAAVNAYTVDRWQYSSNQSGKGSWGRNFGPPGVFALGFPYCLGFGSSSAYTPLTADYFVFQQAIEADMVSDFAWGGAGAQPVTLSFWALAYPLTGTFGGALRNAANTRSYPFTFSLPTTGTWTKIVITIPGDTAGTWVMSGNAASMGLTFDLGSGASNRAPAGAWVAGNYLGANGAVSVVATNSASFYLTGVKLEIGSVATPYNRQSLAKSMADCQRYYATNSNNIWTGNPTSGNVYYTTWTFPVQMRAGPTVTLTYVNSINFPATAPTTPQISTTGFQANNTSNAAGYGFYQFSYIASAEL